MTDEKWWIQLASATGGWREIVASVPVSFTPGFSQVARVASGTGNRLNGFYVQCQP